uniref:X8 domain-containing protein n=1 Tax=Kalanchoe fedtschenkoi TaxID=63787 RepID=A0A7N0ZUC3_KALFE
MATHYSWTSMKLALILSLHLSAILLHCDAGRSMQEGSPTALLFHKHKKELKTMRHYGIDSPFSLPPFDSPAPISVPQGQTTTPYCIYPPFTPTNPWSSPPAPSLYTPPIFPILSPPPGPSGSSSNPYPPHTVPRPPSYVPGQSPTPPAYLPTPSGNPPSFEPSPPSYTPTPGGTGGSGGGIVPNPPVFVPSPPVFQPPVIFPPPAVPPPPHHGESLALWCVAKPSVPDPIIQEAMNYACGSGAECDSIQPNGRCFQPNTLVAHASYAFNSYWQMTKVAGGTCEFGGTAILVTVDPSYDGCHFIIT